MFFVVADLTALVAAGGAGPLPPLSNRGVTVAWSGIHWFAGTVRGLAASSILSVLADFLSVSVRLHQRGGYGYALSGSVGAARVYWSPGRSDVFVVLSGEVCEVLGVPGVVALASTLDLVPSSRLDLAWDVHGITPALVRDAFVGGDVVTRIHRSLNPATGRMKSVDFRSNHEGDTLYLGSRQSERFLRVYDRRGPTRVELEWKGQRAELLWARLLACGEADWSAEALEELRAFVDFRDRSSGVRPDFCPLLDWWSAFTAGAGRSCVAVPRPEARTIEDFRVWLRRQVAPVLALVLDAVPDSTAEVLALVTDGRARYQRRPDRLALLEGVTVFSNAAD